MFIIADNITTRNRHINQIFDQLKADGWSEASSTVRNLREVATRCSAVADSIEINLQQHHDQAKAIEIAVKVVQQVAKKQLCLSTNSPDVLEAGLKVCNRPPIVNFISISEAGLQQLLPLAARYQAEVILLVTDPTRLSDTPDMLKTAAILIGAANEVGITNDRIFIDPGILHITSDVGQRHLTRVIEVIRALPQAFDPPVRSTCWIGNISSGASNQLRPFIEASLLTMLAGAGLSSAFLDVMSPANSRALRLLKFFNNESVYSNSEIEPDTNL
ncbi:MAG: dihydropteroate synthase [Dehalococcoidales bacterium]|nr:dihydropteroate synthase [Dehalococcoidales bacterium]